MISLSFNKTTQNRLSTRNDDNQMKWSYLFNNLNNYFLNMPNSRAKLIEFTFIEINLLSI